jgi:methyl-accepting chemotaxis protein
MRGCIVLIATIVASLLPLPVHGEEVSSTRFSEDARVALGAYRGMVEEHISGIRRALRIIADTPEAKTGKWEECKPLLTGLSNDLTTDATAWLAFPDGTYFATEAAGIPEQNLRDRSYFPTLMSGKEVFGDLVISKSTGHRSLIIAVPVVSGGKTLGAFGVSLRVRLLSELVNEHMPLPPTAYFYALEGDTRIVLHRKAERMFQTPSDVGDEALGEEFKRVLHQDRGVFEYTLQGKKMEAIFEKSPSLGWFFFIAKEV